MNTFDLDQSTPERLMRSFAACLNTGDLDALVSLYEPSAVFEPQPGAVVRGHAAIRHALDGLLALEPAITAETVQVLVAGDTALVVNDWVLTGRTADGMPFEQRGRSADVVRLQADGRWLVVIDKP